MNKYFIERTEWSNSYSLWYTTDGTEPEGAERITRKEAIKLAREESKRRNENPSFAYFADAYIFPYYTPDGYKDMYGETDYYEIYSDAILERHGAYIKDRIIYIKGAKK